VISRCCNNSELMGYIKPVNLSYVWWCGVPIGRSCSIIGSLTPLDVGWRKCDRYLSNSFQAQDAFTRIFLARIKRWLIISQPVGPVRIARQSWVDWAPPGRRRSLGEARPASRKKVYIGPRRHKIR
jgi:hypothetical protein